MSADYTVTEIDGFLSEFLMWRGQLQVFKCGKLEIFFPPSWNADQKFIPPSVQKAIIMRLSFVDLLLHTPAEAAKKLRISEAEMVKLIRSQRIGAMMIKRRWYIYGPTIEAVLLGQIDLR